MRLRFIGMWKVCIQLIIFKLTCLLTTHTANSFFISMHVSKKNVSLRELCPKKMSQREENARIRAKQQNGKIGSK